MSSAARVRRCIIVAACLCASACGNPPDKEMQQAQGAIDAARAAGAEPYAHDEFTAAQQALTRATEAAAQRDYRLALNHALDSRERAQNAAKQAADNKAKARTDADRALTALDTALHGARAKLKVAETARVPRRALTSAGRTISDAETAVQKARAAFEQGDYPVVVSTVGGVNARLSEAARDLEAAARTAPRRRR